MLGLLLGSYCVLCVRSSVSVRQRAPKHESARLPYTLVGVEGDGGVCEHVDRGILIMVFGILST